MNRKIIDLLWDCRSQLEAHGKCFGLSKKSKKIIAEITQIIDTQLYTPVDEKRQRENWNERKEVW